MGLLGYGTIVNAGGSSVIQFDYNNTIVGEHKINICVSFNAPEAGGIVS